jgi:copper chaperone CopZ
MADAAAFAAAAEKVKTTEGAKVSLDVAGMTCGSCSEKLASTLNNLDGVTAAAADYQTGRTEVAYDSSKSNVDAIVKAIEGLGYKASVAKKT